VRVSLVGPQGERPLPGDVRLSVHAPRAATPRSPCGYRLCATRNQSRVPAAGDLYVACSFGQ
jgi:hypothetical protein